METKKTELLQKYLTFVFDTQEETGIATNEQIFEWFWKEIEAREKIIENKDGLIRQSSDNIQTFLTRIFRLEATLEAAEEVVVKASGMISTTKPMPLRSFAVWGELNKALEKYNQQKQSKEG